MTDLLETPATPALGGCSEGDSAQPTALAAALRCVLAALALGFSAVLTLWGFQFGKSIAGLDERTQQELQRLRGEVVQLQEAHAKARLISNTAQSLLTT